MNQAGGKGKTQSCVLLNVSPRLICLKGFASSDSGILVSNNLRCFANGLEL